jgi:GAF domain-containing protein
VLRANTVTDSSTISGNPLLDEESFQKLLAAAYVLQEHQDQQRAGEPPTQGGTPQTGAAPGHQESSPPISATSDYSQTLAQIVATQEQIQRSNLPLPEAMSMIAEQTQFITGASGAAIGLREGNELLYRAASGSAKSLLGTRIAVNSCLSVECLNHDAMFYCPEVDTDSRVDAQVCKQRGIKALIAVPIHQGGKVAGSVEVHFATANSFEEHDVRTCQLMAGMAAEALARAAEKNWKQALADQRTSMLNALQKLRPELQRLASEPEPSSTVPNGLHVPPLATPVAPGPNLPLACPDCGNQLDAEQLFCGQCGSERPVPKKSPTSWASTWHSSQAGSQEAFELTDAEPEDDVFQATTRIFEAPQQPTVVPGAFVGDSSTIEADTQPSSTSTRSWIAETHSHPWNSADNARAWLESRIGMQRAGTIKRVLKLSRADVYLRLAIILVVVTVVWAIWSHGNPPPPVSGTPAKATTASSATPGTVRQRKPAEPKLTASERLLIWLGLAEPPPAPVYSGNPATQVWVDMHTALYYCPGSDLYGKTSKGKFTTQRDAQLDQFEPAYRRACD